MKLRVFAEDKRKEYRFPTDANVEIKVNNHQTFFAACCNISRSGIMMMSNHSFQPADKLKLKIMEAGELIDAEATVLHCRAHAQGYYIGCAASFSEIEPC